MTLPEPHYCLLYILYNPSKNLLTRGSLEYDVFSKLHELHAHKHTGYWKTIDTLKDLEEFGPKKS